MVQNNFKENLLRRTTRNVRTHIWMDVPPDTTKESVDTIGDTNSAFSGCCPAPVSLDLWVLSVISSFNSSIFGSIHYVFQVTQWKKMSYWFKSEYSVWLPHGGQHPEKPDYFWSPIASTDSLAVLWATSSTWTTWFCFSFSVDKVFSFKLFLNHLCIVPVLLMCTFHYRRYGRFKM